MFYESVYCFFVFQTRLHKHSYMALLAYLLECIQSVKCQLQADSLLFKRQSVTFAGLESTSCLCRFRQQCECCCALCAGVFAMKKWMRRKWKDNRWEGIFASHISNMGLVSRTYTDSSSQQQRNKPPNCKMDKRTEWSFVQWKIDEWPGSLWKDAQHHRPLEKGKAKHTELAPHACWDAQYHTEWREGPCARGESGASVHADGTGEQSYRRPTSRLKCPIVLWQEFHQRMES